MTSKIKKIKVVKARSGNLFLVLEAKNGPKKLPMCKILEQKLFFVGSIRSLFFCRKLTKFGQKRSDMILANVKKKSAKKSAKLSPLPFHRTEF